ncbi:MAG: peptidoglycan-binding domain-containing protein [Burkholderiaceae bacterium]
MTAVLAIGFAPHAARAQAPLPSGFLCCNLRVDRDWISDINYRQDGSQVIRAGTPVRGTEWGRYSVGLQMGSRVVWLGNDYSRDLDDRQFSARYIVRTDPRTRIAAAGFFVQDAIRQSRVIPGMTEAETAIALGYPVARYTPSLTAPVWKYWIDRTGEFSVRFDASRRVAAVTGDARVLGVVLYSLPPATVRVAQQLLNDYGYPVGDPDGRLGPATRQGLTDFQRDNGLTPNGTFDVDTLRRLGVEQVIAGAKSP